MPAVRYSDKSEVERLSNCLEIEVLRSAHDALKIVGVCGFCHGEVVKDSASPVVSHDDLNSTGNVRQRTDVVLGKAESLPMKQL